MFVLNNSDWAYQYVNMRKAQRRWVMIVKVPTKKGAMVRA